VLFGTYYMPEGELPRTYGIDDPAFPRDFAGQLLHPFVYFARALRKRPAPPAALPAE
jgi:hypothetical protein